MSAASVKKACSMASPVIAQVQTKKMPLDLHQRWISSKGTNFTLSFLLPSSRQLALGTRLTAIQNHTFFTLSQLSASLMSSTSTTPSQDLKQVATMERNFSWPAVSQMHRRTSLSWRVIVLQRQSMVVSGWSKADYPWMYRQNMEVLPTWQSPTRIILYRCGGFADFSESIQTVIRAVTLQYQLHTSAKCYASIK